MEEGKHLTSHHKKKKKERERERECEIIENKTQQSFNDSHVDADQLRIIYSNIIYIYIIIDAIETFSPK